MPRFFNTLFVVGLTALCPANAAAPVTETPPAPAADAPSVLPKFSVSADVPLKKIAEHRLLEARWAAAAVAHGSYVYVIGGARDGLMLKSVERFDVRTGKSSPFATLRGARRQHGAVLVGDKIYVIGGRVAEVNYASGPRPSPPREIVGVRLMEEPRDTDVAEAAASLQTRLLTTVEIIDLATGNVSSGPAMPDVRSAFGCVVLDGKIYVIGGLRNHDARRAFTNRTLVLDLATGKWSEGIPMPYAAEASAVVVDGFITVAGGYDGQRSYDDVVVFSPKFKGWRALLPLHHSSSAHAMIHLGQHLFLFGSYDRPHELIAYDLKGKTSEGFTLGYDLARHAAAVVLGEKIYVVGGKPFANVPPNDYVQVFELAKKPAVPRAAGAVP